MLPSRFPRYPPSSPRVLGRSQARPDAKNRSHLLAEVSGRNEGLAKTRKHLIPQRPQAPEQSAHSTALHFTPSAVWWQGGTVAGPGTSQENSGFQSWPAPTCMELAFSPRVHIRHFRHQANASEHRGRLSCARRF